MRSQSTHSHKNDKDQAIGIVQKRMNGVVGTREIKEVWSKERMRQGRIREKGEERFVPAVRPELSRVVYVVA